MTVSSKVWTLANVVTAARLLLGAPIAWGLWQHGRGSPGLLVLYVVAALTDGVDGYLARRRGEITKWGILLDPLADKLFGLVIFAAFVATGLLPLWLFVALLVKEGALLVGGSILLRRSGGVVPARALGKVATGFLFTGFGLLLAGLDGLGAAVAYAGVALSLAAGVDYAYHAATMGRNQA